MPDQPVTTAASPAEAEAYQLS